MHKDQFISLLAKICFNAQEYSRDWQVDKKGEHVRLITFKHVSYIICCFLESSTVIGSFGLESDIVLDALVNKPYNLFDWCVYFTDLVNKLEYDNFNYNCG